MDNDPVNRLSQTEKDRWQTFWKFPLSCPKSPIDLARNGFRATGNYDEVVCDHCNVRLSNWDSRHDIRQRHFEASQDCPFAQPITFPVAPSTADNRQRRQVKARTVNIVAEGASPTQTHDQPSQEPRQRHNSSNPTTQGAECTNNTEQSTWTYRQDAPDDFGRPPGTTGNRAPQIKRNEPTSTDLVSESAPNNRNPGSRINRNCYGHYRGAIEIRSNSMLEVPGVNDSDRRALAKAEIFFDGHNFRCCICECVLGGDIESAIQHLPDHSNGSANVEQHLSNSEPPYQGAENRNQNMGCMARAEPDIELRQPDPIHQYIPGNTVPEWERQILYLGHSRISNVVSQVRRGHVIDRNQRRDVLHHRCRHLRPRSYIVIARPCRHVVCIACAVHTWRCPVCHQPINTVDIEG